MAASSTISISVLLSWLATVLLPVAAGAETPEVDVTGHSKTRLLTDAYPPDSVLHDLTGARAGSVESELRLNLAVASGPWSFDGAWQLYGAWGDRIEMLRDLGGTALPGFGYLPDDDRRLLQLTDTIRDEGRVVAVHRLDRFAVGFTRGNVVVRVGRQALSWGNGLIFSPLDIVNPFDPVAVDTEYKAGDDMLYAQFLRQDGDDIELAHVFRREPTTGEPSATAATTAVKYHGIREQAEFDLLAAKHYDETTLGIGGNRSIGGAVLRGDIVWADTNEGGKVQLVTSLSYSWVLAGKNMNGVLEYYHNGFGQPSGAYDFARLATNAALLERLQRGELFTLGRNYLAGSVMIELTPLWHLTPNLFANLDDSSALLQVVSQRSLSDNAELLAALNLPLGPDGSEFGGIASGVPGRYLSTDLSLFLQFAWYF